MRKILVVLLFVVTQVTVFGQKMYEKQFNTCPLKFILEDEQMFIIYPENDSIMVYDFLSGFEQKQTDKIKGVIMIQFMVDTADNVCCVSYTNKTNVSDKKLDIPGRISTMKWFRSSDTPEDINVCTLLAIVFDKKEITVVRTGYNRNRGRKIMTSNSYRRFPEPKKEETGNK